MSKIPIPSTENRPRSVAVSRSRRDHFNLYTNPQEDVSIGIRHIPMMVVVNGTAGWYMKELVKYPPQFKIGFLVQQSAGLRPPAKEQELLKQNLEKSGIGRPTP